MQVRKGTIILQRQASYANCIGDPGYQFERLLTGRDIYLRKGAPKNPSWFEHLQQIDIEGYKILIGAEIDGCIKSK